MGILKDLCFGFYKESEEKSIKTRDRAVEEKVFNYGIRKRTEE